MIKQQMIDRATEEAYNNIVVDVINYLEDFMDDVVADYRFIDFTNESFELINKELENGNKHITYDIIKPAEERIMSRVKKVLLYDDF